MPPHSRNSLLLDQVQPGDEIEVWWPHDAQYYSGVVNAQLPSGRHRIVYDDGEIEDLKLATEQWRLIGAAASRILTSGSAPSLDASSLEPQAHQPASQIDDNQPSNDQAQSSQPAKKPPPAPPSNTKTTSTGKKRGRPRGRKSDTTKTAKTKTTRASQSSSSSVANEKRTEKKPDPAKPVSAKATPATKSKASAVKKRQRSTSPSAQDEKPKQRSTTSAPVHTPLSDGHDSLIDAAPLASNNSKQSSASPAPPSNTATVPVAATSPSGTDIVQTNDTQKKSDVISKPSHTTTLVPPASTKVQKGTNNNPTTPAIAPAQNAVPIRATPAKKGDTTSPQAPPTKTSSTPQPDNTKSQAKTTKAPAAIQKAPGATGRASQSDPTKGRTPTSVQRRAVPIAPAPTPLTRDQIHAVRTAAASKAIAIAPKPKSTSHSGSETIPKNSPTPLKAAPPKDTGKSDTVKGGEMASPQNQQKTFILAANGTIRVKPTKLAPRVGTPSEVRQERGNHTKQVQPQPVLREIRKTAEIPKDTKGAALSKMALATIVSGHKEQKKTPTIRSDRRPSDTPLRTSKPQDSPKQGTSGLKKGNSVLQTAQKGSSKSKGAKASKAVGVKKTISKPAKTIPLKRFVTTPLPDVEGSGVRTNPKDGSDIVADVTVPRRSKSGITSPLLGSPLQLRQTFPSPSKPVPKTTETGAIVKPGPEPTKFSLDQPSPKPLPSVDVRTQDKGERPASKLGPFQPTRRRLKGQSGGAAHQGQHQSPKSPTKLPGKTIQQKLPHEPTLSDKERRGRPSEPQRLNTQREQSTASDLPGTKSYRIDQTSQRASKHSPMPSSKETTVLQASTQGKGSITGRLPKASPVPSPEPGKVQPRSQQTDGSNEVAAPDRMQGLVGASPASDPPKEMRVDQGKKTGVKRAASETLKNAKRRRPNAPKETASSTAANVSGSGKVQVKTANNATNGDRLSTHEKKSRSLTADVANVGASKSQSLRTQAADDKGTFAANIDAPQSAKKTNGLGKDTPVHSSEKSSVLSKRLVKAAQRAKDQPSKNLSDTPKTSALEASEKKKQPNTKETEEGAQKPEPAVVTPPKSFARVRQRPSAGAVRPNDSSRGLIKISKDASEMSPSSAIDAIKQAVHEANMESFEPQLAPIVTRIENCFADSDRRVRSLQGQLDRSTKELESLQKQLQSLRKVMSYIPSISEVRSLLESQALEMKRATAMSMESVVSAVKEDMKEYFSLAIKTGMENVAAMVQKDSIMVISKAVDSAMTSGLLHDMPRPSESRRANGSPNAVPVPNQGVADTASLRGTVAGSAEMNRYLNRERPVNNAEASRPPISSRSLGTGIGTLGRESKRDDHPENVVKESTMSTMSDPKARPSDDLQQSQCVPDRVNDPNLRHWQPVLSSSDLPTAVLERNQKLSTANPNEISRLPAMSQSRGKKIDSMQNNPSQGTLPLSNGFHQSGSARLDPVSNYAPASGAQGQSSNVGSNGLSVAAKSSTVGHGSQPQAALARKENYGLVSTRMKVLLARSAVEWFLKGGCRDFAPQNERTSPVSEKWVRDCVQRSLNGILERLKPENDYRSTMATLTHSVGLHIQTDWLVKGATVANIDIARKNYAEWDPKLFDFEWESEKRVLAMLSDEIIRCEKVLMAAGEIFEDPLRTAILCLERATKQFRS